MKKYFCFFSVITLVFLYSCNKEKSEVSEYVDAREYCPLSVGAYIIYDVIDTTLNLGNVVEPAAYQLKIRVREKLSEPYILEKYTLERYKRNTPSDDWRLDSIWFEIYTKDKEMVFYEVNIPYVKLVTPLRAGISWNGNKYNSNPSENYRTRNFGRPYFINGHTFDNTVTIIQNEDFDNIFGYSNKYEVFAKGIGLIQKELISYRYSQDNQDLVNRDEKVGFIRKMKYVSHGKE